MVDLFSFVNILDSFMEHGKKAHVLGCLRDFVSDNLQEKSCPLHLLHFQSSIEEFFY